MKEIMTKEAKRYISLFLNVAVIFFEVLAFYDARNFGWGQFCYYTQLSNLFAGIVCVLVSFSLLRSPKMPTWVIFLKYCVTIMLTQTFLISLTFLSIAWGGIGEIMLAPIVRYFHTLCPILAIVSFLFFDPPIEHFEPRVSLLAMIPTFIYGAVAITLNVLKVWHGPYPFLYVYEQPVWLSVVWALIIFGAAFLISVLLRIAKRRSSNEQIY